jgi:suppressor for copper-sensitivity B
MLGLAALALCAPAAAQIRSSFGAKSVGGLSSFGGGDDASVPVTVTSQFAAATKDRPAVLMITVEIVPGWHVYSITQPAGGPQRAKIEVTPSPQFRLIGPFGSFPEPTKQIDQVAWVGLELQEHENQVTWYAPIELTAGVDPATVEIQGNVKLQVCKESCVPVNTAFAARLGTGVPIGPIRTGDSGLGTGGSDVAKNVGATSSGTYQAEGSEVKWTGHLEPAVLQPGGLANVVLTATPASGWHIYAWADHDDGHGSKPTLIMLRPQAGLVAGQVATDAAINTDNSVPEFGAMRFHEGPVTWNIPVTVAADAKAGRYELSGIIGYQSCETRGDNMGSCELPQGAKLTGTLEVGGAASADGTSGPLVFSPATYKEATLVAAARSGAAGVGSPPAEAGSSGAYDLDRITVEQPRGSLGYYMLLAFAGGIILNLMPCVLPVIGLKVMSFVQQAGHSRTHALVLNCWYSAGIVSVFLLLGFLAATIGLSWGGQFGSTAFNATLAAIVFAMALSLLGVWEVPIPGFFGGGAAQELAAKEGPLGAFLKGVITTVLATPCTGPFMATAIAWAVTQTMTTTLLVFGSLGLGMASPYLLVGVYPELLRFLPKPGAWMETFKQVMGFVLLATVIFILSFIQPLAVVPTLLLLLGIGVACWWVARTPLTAELNDRLKSWGVSAAVVVLFALVAFGWLYPGTPTGPSAMETASAVAGRDSAWQPFSLAKLNRLVVDERRTVLVDFSAEWCLTCKTLEKAVLRSAPVTQAIAQSGAVTMYADFTEYPPEIERTIKALRSNGVPVIAIFPASAPYEPIVFRGAYTKSELISALERATGRQLDGAAQSVADVTAANGR